MEQGPKAHRRGVKKGAPGFPLEGRLTQYQQGHGRRAILKVLSSLGNA